MPFLLAVLAIAGAVYVWIIRARNAADMTDNVLNAANDVRLAARRFGFRRRANQHPVDFIQDPNLAIGGLACAFLELDDLPTADQRAAMDKALRKTLGISAEESVEIATLGRWFITECGGAQQAVPRLSRKLMQLQGLEALQPALEVVKGTLSAGDGTLSDRQKDALEELRRVFRVE